MPNADPPSDELRELFRHELIRENGALGLSVLGHGEEINRFRYYLETLENYISTEEGQELESLKAQAAKVPETRRGEFWARHYPSPLGRDLPHHSQVVVLSVARGVS